jgi:hypothetical protein
VRSFTRPFLKKITPRCNAAKIAKLPDLAIIALKYTKMCYLCRSICINLNTVQISLGYFLNTTRFAPCDLDFPSGTEN